MKSTQICQIPELNLGCFGCCGRHYQDKEAVLLSIKKNTWAWEEQQPKTHEQIKLFCWRQKPLHPSGICVNIIQKGKRFLCAVHPKDGRRSDVRENYCNTNFLCDAAKAFNKMTEKEKRAYVKFLEGKVAAGMNSYEYSMLNDKEALIKEFKRNKKKKQ